MQDRSYVQRKKQVRLRELTDVVALRGEGDERKAQPEKRGVPEAIHPEVPAAQVRAFEDAGWTFQQRSAGAVPEAAAQAKVFVKEGGRLALGTNQLTVKFPEDVSEERANELLRPYGGEVAQRLTFAPGLFQVAVTDQGRGDLLDVANQLEESGLVEFAEPVLIEQSGGRDG